MDIFLSNFIIGVLSTIIVGIGGYLLKKVHTKIVVQSRPFSIDGYWLGNTHEIGNDGKHFWGYEIHKITYDAPDEIRMKIYQVINDGRHYVYVGQGYIRNEKMVIAYEEKNAPKSRMVGAYELRIDSGKEHSTDLVGCYVEQRRDDKDVILQPYRMWTIRLSPLEKIGLWLFDFGRIRKGIVVEFIKEQIDGCKL